MAGRPTSTARPTVTIWALASILVLFVISSTILEEGSTRLSVMTATLAVAILILIPIVWTFRLAIKAMLASIRLAIRSWKSHRGKRTSQ